MSTLYYDDAKLYEAIKAGEHIYHHPDDRFVVSLIVSYDPERDGNSIESPRDAASAALNLTTDPLGKSGTHWQVQDRATGQTHTFEQDEIEMEHSHL